MLDEKKVTETYSALAQCHKLDKLDEFKFLIRTKIRQIIPHRFLVCGFGDRNERRLLRLINIDCPAACLREVVRPDDIVWSPPIQEWLVRRSPTLWVFEQHETDGMPFGRFGAGASDIRNIVCHGIFDMAGSAFSYFAFGDLDPQVEPLYMVLLNLIVPYLHVVLTNIVTAEQSLRVDRSERSGAASPVHTEPGKPRTGHTAVSHKITEREREVLHWISVGKSNKEISRILGVSQFTVKNHVQNVFAKMSVKTRAQAAARALSWGIVGCVD